jgi:hypothetical protein
MREFSRRMLSGAVASSFLLTACTSLLGDFTNGGDGGSALHGEGGGAGQDGPAGGDGGVQPDGTMPPPNGDASSDAGGGPDSAGDAPALKPLSCVVQGGSTPAKLATVPVGSNGGQAVLLYNTGAANRAAFRAIVPVSTTNGPQTLHVFSFGQGNGGGGGVVDIPVPPGNVAAVARYTSGLAVLFATSIPGVAGQVLAITTLDDSASAWSAPLTVVTSTEFASCTNRLQGALVANNVPNSDYDLAWTYQGCGNTTTYFSAKHFVGTGGTAVTWPLPPLGDSGATGFDLSGMAVTASNVYAIMNPSGNNGPPPAGNVPTLYWASPSLASPTMHALPLLNPSDFMQAFVLQGLPSGNVGLGLLEANLSSTAVQGEYFAGSIPGSKLSTLTPATDLQTTNIPSIQDVVVNNPRYHWESFTSPASDNLIVAGQIYPSSNGVNFWWWNGAGQVVAQKTNKNAFFYFDPSSSGLSFYGADVTFVSPPLAAIASLEMVYVEQSATTAGMGDVWATTIACVP